VAEAASMVAHKISETTEKLPKAAKSASIKVSSLKSKSASSKQAAHSIPVTHTDMEDLNDAEVDIDFNETDEVFDNENECACSHEKCMENHAFADILKYFLSKPKKSDKKANKKAGGKAEKKAQKKTNKAISKKMERYALYGLILLAITFIAHRLFSRRR
jgi:phosphorylcholine metabolism protein LicD